MRAAEIKVKAAGDFEYSAMVGVAMLYLSSMMGLLCSLVGRNADKFVSLVFPLLEQKEKKQKRNNNLHSNIYNRMDFL